MIIFNIDDDADDRESLLDAIRQVNPEIHFLKTENGVDAHLKLTDGLLVHDLSCIFVDMHMPLQDAVGLLAMIKGDRRLSKIPMYVRTSTRDQSTVHQIRKLGAKVIGKNADYKSGVESLKATLNRDQLQTNGL